jgi:aspyridone synthetase trans-acting enoyl reductase
MKALKIRGPSKLVLTTLCPIPQPRPDEILVRVVCVALNPVDWKSADLSPTVGATLGIDYSGEVVSIGSAVKRPFSLGDGVCGGVFGNNPDEPDNGAFAEYLVVPGDLVFKIPLGMSFQDAATLGIGLSTVGLALYQFLKLPFPVSSPSKPRHVLVYGGGTATGTLAIQLLRM